jgi:hypothetical protein
LHLAGFAGEQTGDAFEQGRLAGAIRADQPKDLARCYLEGDVGKHRLTAERLADATHRHKWTGSHATLAAGITAIAPAPTYRP